MNIQFDVREVADEYGTTIAEVPVMQLVTMAEAMTRYGVTMESPSSDDSWRPSRVVASGFRVNDEQATVRFEVVVERVPD